MGGLKLREKEGAFRVGNFGIGNAGKAGGKEGRLNPKFKFGGDNAFFSLNFIPRSKLYLGGLKLREKEGAFRVGNFGIGNAGKAGGKEGRLKAGIDDFLTR